MVMGRVREAAKKVAPSVKEGLVKVKEGVGESSKAALNKTKELAVGARDKVSDTARGTADFVEGKMNTTRLDRLKSRAKAGTIGAGIGAGGLLLAQSNEDDLENVYDLIDRMEAGEELSETEYELLALLAEAQ